MNKCALRFVSELNHVLGIYAYSSALLSPDCIGAHADLEWASSKEALFGLQVCNMHKKYSSCDNGNFSGPGK
jgi:hypothetical protein